MWAFRFTASSTGGLAIGGGTVTVNAPSGTQFSAASDAYQLWDVTGGYTLNGGNGGATVTNNGATITYGVSGRVRAGDVISFVATGVKNPPAGAAFAGISLATSSDTVPVALTSTAKFDAAATVGRVSVSVSSRVAAHTPATWTYAFSTSHSGALGAGAGTITLTAPASTQFPAVASDYTINGTHVKAAPSLSGTNAVTLTVPAAVAAAASVKVVAQSVTNAAGASYPASSFSAATSSDPTSISPPLGIQFSATPAATAVTGLSFSPSTTAGGATGANWSITFTTSGSGGLGTSGTVKLASPTGTSFSSLDLCEVLDLTSGQVNGFPLCAASSSGSTLTVTPDLAISAGDQVAIMLVQVGNPASGSAESAVKVSTSSDAAAASPTGSATFATATAPSQIAFVPSTTAGGATGTNWSTRLTVSSTGALIGDGTITLTAPSGTSFGSLTNCYVSI